MARGSNFVDVEKACKIRRTSLSSEDNPSNLTRSIKTGWSSWPRPLGILVRKTVTWPDHELVTRFLARFALNSVNDAPMEVSPRLSQFVTGW